jgi:glycosyltransferase involved in cell wall biosynthesis
MTKAAEKSLVVEFMDHSFVIPVYQAAPSLAALIESLRAQDGVRSEILLSSSTPSTELDQIAKRHAIPLHINPRRANISADWNFALAVTSTKFVTLAHQDDLFESSYVSRLRAAHCASPGAILAFCDYSEHSLQGPRARNLNLRIKRALCRRAFGARECISATRDKVRLLSLGNPICCPSVMFDRSKIPDFRFPGGFRTNLDWMAWLDLAHRPGGFVYVRDRLISKGVHADSATTATIANRAREREDRAVFDALWPRPIAAALAAAYRLGYRANRL